MENIIIVKNVRGVLGSQKEKVIEEVASADILATSVGQQGLPHIIPNIAAGLLKRKVNLPLDIILAENLRNADQYVKAELKKYLPADYPIDKLVGLVETSIGKMVPIMPKADEEKDILQVFAEPYNTLILDKRAFKNKIPVVDGLAPKENMKAWVDGKSYIHNLGHATTAYIGYLYNPEFIYLYEALAVPLIKDFVRKTMLQSAEVLMSKYPGEFTLQHLVDHTDDLISRFENKALGDTIYRVGCDLQRKLGRNDRIVSVLMEAIDLNKPYDQILFSLICGFRFRAADESGKMFFRDMEFVNMLNEKGFDYVMEKICGLDIHQHQLIYQKAKHIFMNISKEYSNLLHVYTKK